MGGPDYHENQTDDHDSRSSHHHHHHDHGSSSEVDDRSESFNYDVEEPVDPRAGAIHRKFPKKPHHLAELKKKKKAKVNKPHVTLEQVESRMMNGWWAFGRNSFLEQPETCSKGERDGGNPGDSEDVLPT